MLSRTVASKLIGWDEVSLSIPTLKLAEETYRLAISGNEISSLTFFRWMRFCVSPANDSERESIDYIVDKFKELYP